IAPGIDTRRLAEAAGRRHTVGMSTTVENLILDLLEWIGAGERPDREAMEAWRPSCPRLPVWEDATDRGFIARDRRPGEPAFVSVTTAGREHLTGHRTT